MGILYCIDRERKKLFFWRKESIVSESWLAQWVKDPTLSLLWLRLLLWYGFNRQPCGYSQKKNIYTVFWDLSGVFFFSCPPSLNPPHSTHLIFLFPLVLLSWENHERWYFKMVNFQFQRDRTLIIILIIIASEILVSHLLHITAKWMKKAWTMAC